MKSNLTNLIRFTSSLSPTFRCFSTTHELQLKDKKLFRPDGYIGGEWIKKEKKTFSVVNPATGSVIAHLPLMEATETKKAIEAAVAANLSWRNTPAKKRATILRKWYDLMLEHKEDLATILTTEQGKPLTEAMGEILYSAAFLELFSEEATRVFGDVIPPPHPTTRILVNKQPVGIVGAITPWNFPSAMVTRKCAAAIAAGCPVILKPSEFTPLSATALAELASRAGVPAGVFNVVFGDSASIGQALTSDFNVRKITFTGSTRVGKILLRAASDNVQRVSMELGGNAPFIIFDDAHIDKAVAGVIASKFRNCGQTCVSANRIFVQAKIYDSFCAKLVEQVQKLKGGNGMLPGVQVGPLINSNAVKKVAAHVDDAKAKGGKVECGGKIGKADGITSELFYEPTVIKNAKRDMTVFSEETFGPLAAIFKFSDEAEALKLANDTRAGLAAYFYTNDPVRLFRFSEGLEYGMVGINQPIVSHPSAPFGGVKESGLGREGSHYGLNDYLDIKAIHVGLD